MIIATFARLSTGLKMLLILTAALLPLGMIALFASLQSAQTNRLNRESEARLLVADGARMLSDAIARDAVGLRNGMALLPESLDREQCGRMLDETAAAQRPAIGLAVFDKRGRRLCGTSLMSPAPVESPRPGVGTDVRLLPDRGQLRFTLALRDRVGVGEFSGDALYWLAHPRLMHGSYGLSLRQGDAALALTEPPSARIGRPLTVIAPVANGQLALELVVNATPLRSLEILMILLPLLMWVAAAATGWLVVDRLLLRPLKLMQRAVAGYEGGHGPIVIPAVITPAQELRGLGDAFRSVTARLATHEAELEQGLARQTRLTREVHHRVKNNLQVVSSLISLHARGARSDEASEAYSAIQRRVDALAVVHRHHYAELEENLGVGLRALIGELASNLRATAPARAQGMSITLELIPAYASQDVAVPVAFLITELVELVMACDPGGKVAIRLRPGATRDQAELILCARGLTAGACREHASLDRFNRVIEGLSRQLRAKLERDEEEGRYAIQIAIVAPPDDAP